MNTDPIADMLTRIRNACRARHERTDIPLSRLKLRLAEVLKAEGYLDDFREIARSSDGGHGKIEVKPRYDHAGTPVIEGISRVSRPGLPTYYRSKEIPRVRSGLGVMVISTSEGLMSDRAARKANLGGEALCAVW